MRLTAAFKAFFNTLFSDSTEQGAADTHPARENPEPGVLLLLSLLQREGRLVDFVQEDIESYPDAQIGAAVREVHRGCRKVFEEYLGIEAVCATAEGRVFEVPPGFDPRAYRLTGNVKGDPPFRGMVRHHGWRLGKTSLPKEPENSSNNVVAPAEIEIS